MNEILSILGSIICTYTLFFSINTFINTRKKYYEEYIKRKNNEET
ncbi:hypothetical protein ACE193_11260 [Bernardetia sp. OM2101]